MVTKTRRRKRENNNYKAKNGASFVSKMKTYRSKKYSSMYGHTKKGHIREVRNSFL